ncbi:MAG: radical SAM protein, partial [Thermodesulfovibrionales bacterium]
MSSNFFGKVYPTYDHQQLIDAFGIMPSDKVLDIGGGHNPFFRADYIIDSDIADGLHRDGQKIPAALQDKYINADVHNLPFDDKSIDFIYCSHVLEHVLDPVRACSELIRVGKRGFIETPRKWSELFAGYPSHQWLIDNIDGELVFERRQFIESPYLNSLLHAVWRSKRLELNALRTFLNISCLQFCWKDTFSFRVINTDCNNFDYANPEHAALSHYYFAKNIFLLDAPLEHGVFHAKKAAEIMPREEIFLVLLAGYALALGDSELWSKTRTSVARHGMLSRADKIFLNFGVTKSVLKKIRSFIENYKNELSQKDSVTTAASLIPGPADSTLAPSPDSGAGDGMEKVELSPPRTYFLELTNHCNLRCSMCNFHSPEVLQRREKGFMQKDLAFRLLDEMAAFSPEKPWVALHGAGEPLLYKPLPEILTHGVSLGLDIGFLTNAVLLNPQMSGKILDTGLSWVGFSIDGINRDTFNKYRCGADYDLVVGNVIT